MAQIKKPRESDLTKANLLLEDKGNGEVEPSWQQGVAGAASVHIASAGPGISLGGGGGGDGGTSSASNVIELLDVADGLYSNNVISLATDVPIIAPSRLAQLIATIPSGTDSAIVTLWGASTLDPLVNQTRDPPYNKMVRANFTGDGVVNLMIPLLATTGHIILLKFLVRLRSSLL
jgi:hypothetical protein